MNKKIKIGETIISKNSPTYFIADIASNHDGSLNKAKELIHMCAEAGSNAAKFQNFTGETLVCDKAFRKIGNIAHQSSWKESTFDGYNKVSVPIDWSQHLKEECEKYKIEYFTSPYCLDFIDELEKYVSAWKVGSGDITFHDSIEKMSKSKKPIIIATGASTEREVKDAVEIVKKNNDDLILMQCNTNYTGSNDNFKYINLNVLKTYEKLFPDVILGLSDHTPGHATVLGSVAIGARVIEKHFTDNNDLEGPDHKFSLSPKDWKIMVEKTRELESSLGGFSKIVEENEKETVVIQRRGIRSKKFIKKGEIVKEEHLNYLRPCDDDCIPPSQKIKILGKKAKKNIEKDDPINLKNVE